jgi:hypothetical protein
MGCAYVARTGRDSTLRSGRLTFELFFFEPIFAKQGPASIKVVVRAVNAPCGVCLELETEALRAPEISKRLDVLSLAPGHVELFEVGRRDHEGPLRIF